MNERLKQIWSGFEAKTERRLTGRGVENIVAPSRAVESAPAVPTDYIAPAEAAFAALRKELASAERSKGGRARGEQEAATRSSYAADQADFGARLDLAAGEPIAAMLKGLASTERRIERPPLDYAAFSAQNADRKLSSLRKRRKFLGLF